MDSFTSVDGSLTTSKTSSLIGVAICAAANFTVSLALNTQKLAHKRVSSEQEQTDDDLDKDDEGRRSRERRRASKRSRVSAIEEGVEEDVDEEGGEATERTALLGAQRDGEAGNGKLAHDGDDDTPSRPSVSPVQPAPDRQGSEDSKTGKVDSDRTYLRSRLWWLGLTLMLLGELGNFISYGFAPASLVAPLGSVALIANCFISPLMLKEPFRKKDLAGIALCIIGAATVVYSSKESDEKLTPDRMLIAIRQLPFVIYSSVSLFLIITLCILSRTSLGDRFVFVDIGLCALTGAFTVLSTKAMSGFLNLMFLDCFKKWITYPILAILIITAIVQVNFLNKALQRFDARVVVPSQFCAFTISAILGSAILYGDFKDAGSQRMINFLFGCAVVFFGVYVLTKSHSSTSSQSSTPYSSRSASPSPSQRSHIHDAEHGLSTISETEREALSQSPSPLPPYDGEFDHQHRPNKPRSIQSSASPRLGPQGQRTSSRSRPQSRASFTEDVPGAMAMASRPSPPIASSSSFSGSWGAASGPAYSPWAVNIHPPAASTSAIGIGQSSGQYASLPGRHRTQSTFVPGAGVGGAPAPAKLHKRASLPSIRPQTAGSGQVASMPKSVSVSGAVGEGQWIPRSRTRTQLSLAPGWWLLASSPGGPGGSGGGRRMTGAPGVAGELGSHASAPILRQGPPQQPVQEPRSMSEEGEGGVRRRE